VPHYYFDHNATTPLAPEVLEALAPALGEVYGNASSIHHFGQAAKQRLEAARRTLAAALGADARDIVFNSGGTESDNLAVLGAVRASTRQPRHVITTAIEHPAVLASCAQLEREGVAVTYLKPLPDGAVDPGDVRRALRPETVLVSVMHANNETGAVQPVAEIAAIAREAGAVVHSDGVQAFGKIPVDVAALGVDLYSVSAHKINGPKGAGALYVRKGTRLAPLAFGGHHERDRRPGTENVPGAVALAAAAALPPDSHRLARLRDRLEQGILARVPRAHVNAAAASRVPNTSNIRFDYIDSEALVIALDLAGFAVSTGSACSSGALEPSHVLSAMGFTPAEARGAVRFSLGRGNCEEQVDALVEAVAVAVERLRKVSAVAPA
jgi:cysteine desulfurase